MIKRLKLQKAVYLIIAGIFSLIAYKILDANGVKYGIYFKTLAGVFVIIGAIWLLYPILFAKKDRDGNVEIITDPTVEAQLKEDVEKPIVD